MSIKFVCPNGHRLVVPDNRAGKKGRCPVCHQRLYVPEPAPNPRGRHKRQPDPFELEQYAPEEQDIEVDIEFEELVTPTKPPAEPHDDLERALLEELGIDPESSSPRFPPPAARQQPPTPPQARMIPAPPLSANTVAPVSSYATPPPAAPIATPLSIPTAPSMLLPTAYPSNLTTAYAPVAAPVSYPANSMVAGMAATVSRPTRTPTSPTGWVTFATSETIGWGEHASADWLGTTYVLAGMTAGAGLFSLGPAIHNLAIWSAPQWAQIVIGVALVQLVYAIWLVTIPDWMTLRLGMLLNSLIAALFAGGLMIVLGERSSPTLPLDLGEVRNTAGGWCAAQITVSGVLSYAYNRSSGMWRRSWRRERLQNPRPTT